jgi:hypothetical protein
MPGGSRSVLEKKMNHEEQILELTAFAKQVEAPEDALAARTPAMWMAGRRTANRSASRLESRERRGCYENSN